MLLAAEKVRLWKEVHLLRYHFHDGRSELDTRQKHLCFAESFELEGLEVNRLIGSKIKNNRLPGGAFTLAHYRSTSSGPGHQDLSTSQPPTSRFSEASPASRILTTQSTKTAPRWRDAGGATSTGKPATCPAEGSLLGNKQHWQRDCILPATSSSIFDNSLTNQGGGFRLNIHFCLFSEALFFSGSLPWRWNYQ